MMFDCFKLGDPVLLIYDSRRKWIKSISNDDFHCNYGFLNLGSLIGKKYGTNIETNKGITLKAVNPTLLDWFDHFEHKSQIIYAKDAALICILLDIKPGDTIYEAGTGSGALTSLLSRYVGKEGKVITHENRKDAQQIAIKNLKKLSISNVEFHLVDVVEHGFHEGIADAFILDLSNPWQLIHHVVKSLKNGGRIVLFQPSFNQLEKTMIELKYNGFTNIKAIELLEREIQLKENAIRPKTRMIGHTGYLMSATLYK